MRKGNVGRDADFNGRPTRNRRCNHHGRADDIGRNRRGRRGAAAAISRRPSCGQGSRRSRCRCRSSTGPGGRSRPSTSCRSPSSPCWPLVQLPALAAFTDAAQPEARIGASARPGAVSRAESPYDPRPHRGADLRFGCRALCRDRRRRRHPRPRCHRSPGEGDRRRPHDQIGKGRAGRRFRARHRGGRGGACQPLPARGGPRHGLSNHLIVLPAQRRRDPSRQWIGRGVRSRSGTGPGDGGGSRGGVRTAPEGVFIDAWMSRVGSFPGRVVGSSVGPGGVALCLRAGWSTVGQVISYFGSVAVVGCGVVDRKGGIFGH